MWRYVYHAQESFQSVFFRHLCLRQVMENRLPIICETRILERIFGPRSSFEALSVLSQSVRAADPT